MENVQRRVCAAFTVIAMTPAKAFDDFKEDNISIRRCCETILHACEKSRSTVDIVGIMA